MQTNYYERFIADIESDLSVMKEIHSADSIWIEKNKWLYDEFTANRLTEENIVHNFNCLNGIPIITLTSTTYNEITNSGNWHLIDDDEISRYIHEYYGNVQNIVLSLEEQLVKFCYSYINPFINKIIVSIKTN